MRLRSILKHARLTQNIQFLLRNYKYRPLPSRSSIRLLQLDPSLDRSVVRCSLKTYELHNVPNFSALSYTWGDWQTPIPAVGLELGTAAARLNQPSSVEKDVKYSNVQRKLDYAKGTHPVICDGQVLKVTSNLRDALRMLVKSITAQSTPVMPRYYWIDALCIDQSNILERNNQVAIMADIFKAAQSVLVWLGKEDEFTPDAITTIERISGMSEDEWRTIPYTAFYEPHSSQHYHRLGLTFYNWLGLVALLNRPWFKRAWVVQEIALARSALVICGSRALSWDKLSKTLKFLKNTRWYHHLQTEKLRHLSSLAKSPGIYKHLLRAKLDAGIGPIFLDATRHKMVSSSHLRSHEGFRKPPLWTLLETHRSARSSDPRDKVYAFLGLADRRLEPFRHNQNVLVPNYNLSVQEVYTETARALLVARTNLSLLSYVQDPSITKVPGLPSWVPDYSVALDPYPLRFRGPGHWRASGRTAWTPNTFALADGQLEAQGYLLGYIDQTSVLPGEHPDPAASWASIVKLALSLDLPYPDPAKRRIAPSRIEVLWRTLTTNIYNRTYPAPPETGSLFIDYVLNLQIRHRLRPWSGTSEFQPHHSPISDSIYPEWNTLLKLEPPKSPYSRQKYRERLTTVVESIFDGTYSPIDLAQLQHEFDQSGGKRRRLFRTASNYLGTGPRSLRQGDEVWILNGGSLPFVLRRLPNGNSRLIGESFVYGVMHGEVMAMEQPRRQVVIE